MCKILGVKRSTYYYQSKVNPERIEKEARAVEVVTESFEKSRGIYGARKIKADLERQDLKLSIRRIRRIMKEQQLVSVYNQQKAYKPYSKGKNERPIPNVVDQNFQNREPLEVIVSDLTYVKVDNK